MSSRLNQQSIFYSPSYSKKNCSISFVARFFLETNQQQKRLDLLTSCRSIDSYRQGGNCRCLYCCEASTLFHIIYKFSRQPSKIRIATAAMHVHLHCVANDALNMKALLVLKLLPITSYYETCSIDSPYTGYSLFLSSEFRENVLVPQQPVVWIS